MEFYFEVRKNINFFIYNTTFATSGGGVGEVVVNRTNYQRCQFDVDFI